jgi:alkyl hydroperoxide reductase subunit F
MYDLVIIGGGPAGLTAAVYAVRKRLNFLLISPDLGGKANARMTVEGLDTYHVIKGEELVSRFRNEIEYLDFARLLEKVIKLERNVLFRGKSGKTFIVTTASGRQLEARAVILATGANAGRLNVPGADRFFLRGVSYSTVSYAPLYIDRQVAVVGAGSMALRGAAELAQIARRVYLVAPEQGELDSALGRRLRAAANVTIFEGWEPAVVEGDTYARQLVIKAPPGEPPTHRGPSAPEGLRLRTLDVDAIFVELGLIPQSELVEGWVELDDQKRVIVNCAAQTSVPGLFAAGDVTHLPAEQVLIAIGEGAKAALNAYEYLLK